MPTPTPALSEAQPSGAEETTITGPAAALADPRAHTYEDEHDEAEEHDGEDIDLDDDDYGLGEDGDDADFEHEEHGEHDEE